MTTTYDPSHSSYFDPLDLRQELTRVYDLCHGCRLCLSLCPSFPSMFNAIDARDGDVAALTPQEQDKVVDECYGCKLCYLKCPYIPPHEWDLDFPRLMLRAKAVKVNEGSQTLKERVTDRALAMTDVTGRVVTPLSAIVNRVIGTPGSPARGLIEAATGISKVRLLPPYTKVRFSTWFRGRVRPFIKNRRAKVSVYPTCFVEYMEPRIGIDLVKVYEKNGIECSMAEGVKCCGAPWLHQGNVDEFIRVAQANVRLLTSQISEGKDIVVAQPTCAYVIKKDYPLYLGTNEAAEISAHTFDSSEYLMKLHKSGGGIDTDFSGAIPKEVTYHASCHLQAQNVGLKGRDLIKLTGAKVNVVSKCSGIDGTWGYRSENVQMSKKIIKSLVQVIDKTNHDQLAGECHLANTAILEETGEVVSHPMQIIARAYGLEEE